jgi:hypothetical protein
VKVIAHHGVGEQVDAEVGGKMFQAIFDPDLAVVKVLSGQFVLAKKKTSPHGAIVNVNDVDFAWINDFAASFTHDGAPEDRSVKRIAPEVAIRSVSLEVIRLEPGKSNRGLEQAENLVKTSFLQAGNASM